ANLPRKREKTRFATLKNGHYAGETGSPLTASSARESASNRCVFVVSSLVGEVLILPRVSAPANASAATRDAKCLGAGRERPQGLSRPFSSRRMWSVSAAARVWPRRGSADRRQLAPASGRQPISGAAIS